VNDVVEPAWSAGVLLLIAALGVLALLFLIMKVKMHAFLALVLVSLGVALAARIPVEEVVGVLTSGFGTTLASVALLVGLGAMLGRLLEFSGGAQVLADSLVRRFGERRAPLALGVAALLFGFPIFFDAGLVVFLPIVFTIARRLGGSLLTYGLPVAGAFAVMHAFVPPHPGPVAAAELIGADIGLVLVFGLLIGLPTWYLGGYLFGTWAGRKYHVGVPDILSDGAGGDSAAAVSGGSGSSRRVGGAAAARGTRPNGRGRHPRSVARRGRPCRRRRAAPSFCTVSPCCSAARADLLQHRHEHLVTAGRSGGALLRPARPADRRDAGRAAHHRCWSRSYVLRTRRGTDKPPRSSPSSTARSARSARSSSSPVPAACSAASCARAASARRWPTCLEDIGLPVIVAAFVISVLLRIAQGSATVALTTAAGLIAPVVEASEGSPVRTWPSSSSPSPAGPPCCPTSTTPASGSSAASSRWTRRRR
jgi:GntP family gluconate:H+ symporter